MPDVQPESFNVSVQISDASGKSLKTFAKPAKSAKLATKYATEYGLQAYEWLPNAANVKIEITKAAAAAK